MTHYNKHSEWVLAVAIRIDEQSAGFCGSVLRSSVEKRHIIAAFLAARPDATEQAREVAPFLLSADHRTILSEAYGEAPEGMRGALRRSGPAVHEKRFYGVLHKLLSKPRHDEIPKCISRFEVLNLTLLRVANILPAHLCQRNVVEALANVQAARDLLAAVELLVATGADQKEVEAAIGMVRDQAGLTKVIHRLMLACKGADHPVPGTEDYRPVTTARELHRVAAKFRNCARQYTIDFLDSDAGHAFAEARYGKEGAVVHLRRKEGEWRLEGVFGPRNSIPSPELRRSVSEHLMSHGIEPRDPARIGTKWSPVRRLTRAYLYEFDLDL